MKDTLVFIDDSGDPGFKVDKGSSKYFVICCVIFTDNLEAEKTSLAIKELRRKLKKSDFYEFKFNKTNRKFRNAFFNTVKKYKFKVRAISVNKKVIYSQRLQTNKEDFYNYIIMQVIKHSKGKIKNAKLKFDRRGEISIRNQLRAYLSRSLDNKSQHIFRDLKFVDSRQNTLIQLADMIAGSIYYYCSNKDKSFLKILKSAGRIEDIWEFK